MRAAVLCFFLVIAGCAPSVDLRIPTPDEPLDPGRLLVVPVSSGGRTAYVQALGNVVTDAEFGSEDEHEVAFWTALVSGLNASLGHVDVRLGSPVDRSTFEPHRVRIQGQTGGYGHTRWTVETIDLPTTVDFEALNTDYVLFVDEAAAVTDLSGQSLVLPIGRVTAMVTLPTKGINAGGRMVLVQAGQPVPLLAHRIWAGEDGGGILDNRLSRRVWDRAVSKLAASVAAAAEGR